LAGLTSVLIFETINQEFMRYLCLSICCLLIISCSNNHYCYVVRHAEKLDNTPYSVLSPKGHERAAKLKDILLSKKIDMVFATTFRRTQETGAPLANALGKPLLIYRNNAVDSIAAVVNGNRNRNILLVGHSGNIPSIIEGITGQKVAPIREDQYDNLYIIKFTKREITVTEEKY
jgi:broad specificity phosphatase PhoE